jgi:hypothetical protein
VRVRVLRACACVCAWQEGDNHEYRLRISNSTTRLRPLKVGTPTQMHAHTHSCIRTHITIPHSTLRLKGLYATPMCVSIDVRTYIRTLPRTRCNTGDAGVDG